MTQITQIDVISRKELREEWRKNYESGHHVAFIGPKQKGKTTLSHILLAECISPERKAILLAGKPPDRDPVMNKAAQRLNLRIIEEWPPPYSIRDRNRNGYVVRPHQTLKDLDADNDNIRKQFRAAMMSAYASKSPVILDVDEAGHVYGDMGLKKEYEAPLMRGAPICAQWMLIQRGRNLSYHSYSAPDHIFLFKDDDRSNVDRYSEFGGIDPRQTRYLVENLRLKKSANGQTVSEALYIRRAGPEYMIVSFD
jgi:hypothetical protein